MRSKSCLYPGTAMGSNLLKGRLLELLHHLSPTLPLLLLHTYSVHWGATDTHSKHFNTKISSNAFKCLHKAAYKVGRPTDGIFQGFKSNLLCRCPLQRNETIYARSSYKTVCVMWKWEKSTPTQHLSKLLPIAPSEITQAQFSIVNV